MRTQSIEAGDRRNRKRRLLASIACLAIATLAFTAAQAAPESLRIGIIGTGKIGGALA